jgi:hypothetical protein
MLQKRKTYDSVKVNRVGAFGEALTQALLPKSEPAQFDEGDFYIPSANTAVEVKLTDSMHEWRIPLHQLEAFRVLRSFPYDGFWFFLFVYRNWYIPNGKPRGSTALSAYNETIDVNSFIADNLQHLFILDIEFVQGLKDKQVCRVSDKSIPLHPGRESLNIRPARMKGIIADDSWKEVVSDPQNWVLRNRKVKFRCKPDMFERYDIPLNVHIIGREKGTRKISRLLSA